MTSMKPRRHRLFGLLILTALGAQAQILPPKNPALTQGICALTHCDGYQTGAMDVRGPQGPSHRLRDEEIDLLWESPISAGAFDITYPDGRTAYWVTKVDRVEKLTVEQGKLKVVQELRLPMQKFPYYSGEDMQRFVAELDRHPVTSDEYRALAATWKGYETEALRAFYGALGRDGTLYVGAKDRIIAYGDAEPGRIDSPIVQRGEFVFDPTRMNKAMPVPIIIGFNALHDGHLAVVSMDGTVIVIAPDLKSAQYYRLGGETIWNGVAVDEKNALYLAGNKTLLKLIWKNGRISDDPADGAWRESYDLGPRDKSHRGARGTGTTPVLMGAASERDRFVIITDAADVNNAVLYWRDEIPADWQALPGERSRRVAGKQPVDCGVRTRVESYSENAAAVLGYGAVLGNNRPPKGESMTLDVVLRLTDPALTPLGMHKFVWDPQTRQFRGDWIRPDVSSPSGTPIVSARDQALHVGSIDQGNWAWTTIDWLTGKTRAVYTLGPSPRYNPAYIAIQLLPNGDPLYAGFGGTVHLRLGQEDRR
ncbi:MAG: hypothetical protein IPP18_12870 [Rhodocyclaceae bacterium]|nr:hypothetical protein [Rhodocyclaceae bacterium]